MKKKLILLLVAVCMLLTCFACGGGKKPGNGITPPPSFNEKWGALPDEDFGSEAFRISTRDGYETMEVLVADENSENLLDLALMYRNAAVEDRYNVVITPVSNGGGMGEQINGVLNDCIQNADKFELAMTYVFESAPLITNGYVYNWNKLKYTNLDQSQWINGMNEKFAVRDAIYTAVSKMCVSTFTNTFAFFYNRDLGEQYDPEFSNKLFDTIRSGDWTYDYLMNFVNEYGYTELDNVSGRTAGDGYAYYATTDWIIDAWHAAWDIPMISNTVENGLEDVYMSDKLLSFVDRMHTMYYNTPGIMNGNQGAANTSWMADRSVFTTNWLNATFTTYDSFDGTYTVLPFPKYDENQTEYRSAMADNYSVLSIPISADPDDVSLIVEALSLASEEHMYDAYQTDALQGNTVSDPDTIEMIQYVFNNISWDIGTLLFSETKLMDLARLDVMRNPGASQIAKTYDEMKDDVAAALERIMTAFDLFQDN